MPNSAEKGQTDCLKARKSQTLFAVFFVTKKHLNYKYIKKMSSNYDKISSCLALCWRLELIITDTSPTFHGL